MTDVKLLNEKIDASGLKRNFIAKQLGITPQGFHLKTSGKNEFTSSQIQKMCDLLRITTQKEIKAIFFSQAVDAKST
jgi:hypothetical protein